MSFTLLLLTGIFQELGPFLSPPPTPAAVSLRGHGRRWVTALRFGQPRMAGGGGELTLGTGPSVWWAQQDPKTPVSCVHRDGVVTTTPTLQARRGTLQ